MFILFIISLTELLLDAGPVPELCRRLGCFSNLVLLCTLSLLVFLLSVLFSALSLADSIAILEDGGEDEAPPLTLVTSPDLRSTPTIDHGRGLGNGFGLGPAPIEGTVVFSCPDAAVCDTIEVLPVVHGFVAEELIAEDKLVVLGLISGNFPLLEFDEFGRFDGVNFDALRPTMEPPIFCVSSILELEDFALFEDENVQSLVSKFEDAV